MNLKDLFQKTKEAEKQRPDIPKEDMVFQLGTNSATAVSFEEMNQGGKSQTILLVRCKEAAPTSVVPGASKRICGTCSEEVWMSPAMVESVKKMNKIDIVCLTCFLKTLPPE